MYQTEASTQLCFNHGAKEKETFLGIYPAPLSDGPQPAILFSLLEAEWAFDLPQAHDMISPDFSRRGFPPSGWSVFPSLAGQAKYWRRAESSGELWPRRVAR